MSPVRALAQAIMAQIIVSETRPFFMRVGDINIFYKILGYAMETRPIDLRWNTLIQKYFACQNKVKLKVDLLISVPVVATWEPFFQKLRRMWKCILRKHQCNIILTEGQNLTQLGYAYFLLRYVEENLGEKQSILFLQGSKVDSVIYKKELKQVHGNVSFGWPTKYMNKRQFDIVVDIHYDDCPYYGEMIYIKFIRNKQYHKENTTKIFDLML